MPNGDKQTSREHFVPRLYLKGFSETKSINKENKHFIWQYDLESMRQSSQAVPINSICYENDLYEIKDRNGEIIAKNYVEDKLNSIEKQVDIVIRSVIKKAENADFLPDQPFLSENEKCVLILFLSIQMLRDPESLEIMAETTKMKSPEYSDLDAKNSVLLKLFPKDNDAETNRESLLLRFTEKIYGMAFQVGISNEDSIITSDRPYAVEKISDAVGNRFKTIIFPLTSRIVLYLHPLEYVDPQGWNCCFSLDKDRVRDLTTNISFSARRWIFSRNPLTGKQIDLINAARQLTD